MKRNKLLTLFAAAMILFGVQSASAAIKLTALSGSGFGGGEGCQKLFDGTQNTKWGTWDGWYHTYEGNAEVPNVIFKASLPIAVADYELVIANDTKDNPGRNWKSWRIFGGNFASDADATLGAEGWVLIDEKVDQALTTEPFAVVPLSVSNPDGKFYSYFMIIIDAICSENAFDDYTQMDEFRFTNYTVDISAFAELINQCKEFDLTGVDELLTAEYNNKLNQLTSSEDPAVIEQLLSELSTLQDFITTYKDKTFAPVSAVGTNVWGDGSWEHLVDGDMGTKCGGNLPEDGAWLVFRANGGAQPFVYSLVTGGDTKKYPGRNWKTWKIFGANFENVADATRSADGWVLLDSRENVGQDLFPAENLNPATFSFSEFPDGLDKPYYYFKVELIEAYSGTQYQMTELEFLTKQQVEETRANLLAEFDDFDVENLQVEPELADVKAEYLAKLEELKTTNDVVAMSKAYNALKELRKQLQASADYVAGDCYHALDGNTAWGDGENWTKLVDGDIETKWGGGMPEGGSYVIFKAYSKSTYGQYMLVTGNDTKNSPDRNWKTWKIYGIGGKVTDSNATRDNSAWKLIDSKENIGQDRLPGDNFVPAYFNISEEWTTAYQYFKIEVEAAYDGGSIQMSEFKFLSDEKFAAARQEYVDALTGLAMDLQTQFGEVSVPQSLVDQITAAITEKISAVAAATADELLPAYNAALNYITVDVPAMVAAAQLTQVDGVYQIANAYNLASFASLVNAGETTAKAVLTADIDLADAITGDAWTSIGTNDVPFQGEFDGKGYTIKNITYTATGQYNGLFGKLSSGAVVKNFTAEGTLTVSAGVTGRAVALIAVAGGENVLISNINSKMTINNNLAGAQVGGVLGGALNGTTTVDRCTYSGTMDGNDAGGSGNYGGLVGYANNNAACFLTISNCLFDGTLVNNAATPGNCTFGGMIGYSNGANVTIKNDLSIGTVTSPIAAQFFGAVKSTRSSITNSYYQGENVNGSASTVTLEGAVKVTDEQLASGEVAVNLGTAFRQNLGTDAYPVLEADHNVVVEITSAGYATMYLPATSVEIPEGVEAFTGTIEGDLLWLHPLQNVVINGQAVVLKGAAGYYGFKPVEAGFGLIQSDLIGAEEDMDAAGKYVLAKPEGEPVGFYLATTGTIKAGKAYIENAAGVKGFVFADEATGIANVEKTVENGIIYNLAGQRVSKAQKGINIINGKKVLF